MRPIAEATVVELCDQGLRFRLGRVRFALASDGSEWVTGPIGDPRPVLAVTVLVATLTSVQACRTRG